jgi:hypothetical protein
MTTALIPFTGSADLRETVFPFTDEIDVCTVEGKNPAKRGREANAISASLRIAILYFYMYSNYIIQDYTSKRLKVY